MDHLLYDPPRRQRCHLPTRPSRPASLIAEANQTKRRLRAGLVVIAPSSPARGAWTNPGTP
jgi:hypothetical protein